ncbi:MAG: response regulator [Thermodesulfovibrio sp.]
MNKKVLIIEENEFVREFLCECLLLWGYEPETVVSTNSLLSCNFIIADYKTIRELDLIESISEIASYKPIIITSTTNCPEERILKEKAFCINKPFYINELKEILKIFDEGLHKELQLQP